MGALTEVKSTTLFVFAGRIRRDSVGTAPLRDLRKQVDGIPAPASVALQGEQQRQVC